VSPVFFTDRDLGKKFPQILRDAGLTVERHADHFAPDTPDEQWLETIGRRNWIAITHDGRIRSPNNWEQIKRQGDASVKRWIDDNMKYKRCVIVLVGNETANRPWVRYEIEKAYNSGKGLFGIYIHNLNCPRTGRCIRGVNPFDSFTINDGQQPLSAVIPCHDPGYNAYAGISNNLAIWVAGAIGAAKYR